MMEGLQELSLEIRRIAECPYTPSLKVCRYLWMGMLRIEICRVSQDFSRRSRLLNRSELIH